MPGNRPRGLSDLLPIEQWIPEREDLRRLTQVAEAKGRAVWNDATRAGKRVLATQPSDVIRLGKRALQEGRSVPAATKYVGVAQRIGTTIGDTARAQGGRIVAAVRPSTQAAQKAAREIAAAVRPAVEPTYASVRGAQDALTLGLGDVSWAAAGAALDRLSGKDFQDAYATRIQREHERDRYDAQHHGAARLVGQVGGTALQVLATGGIGGAATTGLRMSRAAPLLARELGVISGAGAGAGVLAQSEADTLSGRTGTLGDYAGAALGGAIAAPLALRLRAGPAAGVGGVVTSLAQDGFNGRLRSGADIEAAVQNARQAALLGALVGGVASGGAANWVDALPIRAKGELGEALSRVRTAARGQRTAAGPKTRELLPREGYIVPDSRSIGSDGLVLDIIESKFGKRARLSHGQARALDELTNFRLDHFLPRDIGVAASVPAAELGYWTGARLQEQGWR
jgi:hypothetical protein